ncbi:MAG TPA: hypothetical protein VGD08_11755 [Stellaceae bacterium]
MSRLRAAARIAHGRTTMRLAVPLSAIAVATISAAAASAAAERLRFWNLTTVTISQLYLAQTGTSDWGPNQCLNDRDKEVDADERLALTGIGPGRYDVKLADKTGRTCIVRNVEVKTGGKYAFSIADQDLRDCTK